MNYRTAGEAEIIMPPAEQDDRKRLAELERLLRNPASLPKIVGPDGEEVLLHPDIYRMVKTVVANLVDGRAMHLAARETTLSTQQAAEVIGVSRNTMVRWLKEGKIPFEQPGKHRRLKLNDVLDFKDRLAERQMRVAARMTARSLDSGIIDHREM